VTGGDFFWLKKERPTMVERERERAIGDVVLLWVFPAVGRERERERERERL